MFQLFSFLKLKNVLFFNNFILGLFFGGGGGGGIPPNPATRDDPAL